MAVAMTGKFPKHLDRDIDKIFMDTYMKYPNQYTQVAKISNFPTGNKLTEARLSGLGNHRQLGEAQGVEFDLPVEGREKTVFPIKFGLGFQITEEMIEDAVHPNVNKMPASLAVSANHTLELYFWDLFSSGDDVHKSDDDAFIFAAHTTLKSKDTITNKVAVALSETALQASFEYFDTLVDEAGYPVFTKFSKLIVPTKLRWLANRLAKQQGGITNDTDDKPALDGNDMTTNPANGYVDAWSPMVVRYLDPAFGGDDEDWFAISNDHDMRLIWKRKIRMESSDDFHTGNRLYKSTMRFQTAAFDYKGVYGSFLA